MSRVEKLKQRLLEKPKDFTWDELIKILTHHGYEEIKTGKTAGSRRAFVHKESKRILRLHKPHPGNLLKQYQIDEIVEELKLNE